MDPYLFLVCLDMIGSALESGSISAPMGFSKVQILNRLGVNMPPITDGM